MLTISLHAVGGDLFAGQTKAENEKDKPGYGYVMFRVAGNETVLHAPQCDQQDKAMLKAFGVESADTIASSIGSPIRPGCSSISISATRPPSWCASSPRTAKRPTCKSPRGVLGGRIARDEGTVLAGCKTWMRGALPEPIRSYEL